MAFVTHTGNNGLLEAIHYRVPMVGLPIYMNQEDNLARLVEKGIAVGVSKWSDAEEIYQAITKVISNRRSANFLQKQYQPTSWGKKEPESPTGLMFSSFQPCYTGNAVQQATQCSSSSRHCVVCCLAWPG